MTRCYFTSVKVKVVIPTCAVLAGLLSLTGEKKRPTPAVCSAAPSPHQHTQFELGGMCWKFLFPTPRPAPGLLQSFHKGIRSKVDMIWRESAWGASRMPQRELGGKSCHLTCHHLSSLEFHLKAGYSQLYPRISQILYY